MKKVILLSLSFGLCHGMQQDATFCSNDATKNLKATFFKALEEGDFECVKSCVEQDSTLVNACDEDGVCALTKVAQSPKFSIVDKFVHNADRMMIILLQFGHDDPQGLEYYQEKVSYVEAAQLAMKKRLEIFRWLLGAGVDKSSVMNCFYFLEGVDILEVFSRDIEKKLLWIVLSMPDFWDKNLSEAQKRVQDRSCRIVRTLYTPEAGVKETCRKSEQLWLDLHNFLMDLYVEPTVEHDSKKQKRELSESDFKNHLRIAFMGRSFLPQFEELFSNVPLGDVAQMLDKKTMLIAMKTRSQAFDPLFRKMLLFPQSEAVLELSRNFYDAFEEYKTWWSKGALEVIRIKVGIETEHRWKLMRVPKKI